MIEMKSRGVPEDDEDVCYRGLERHGRKCLEQGFRRARHLYVNALNSEPSDSTKAAMTCYQKYNRLATQQATEQGKQDFLEAKRCGCQDEDAARNKQRQIGQKIRLNLNFKEEASEDSEGSESKRKPSAIRVWERLQPLKRLMVGSSSPSRTASIDRACHQKEVIARSA